MRRAEQREWVMKLCYQTMLDIKDNDIKALLEAHSLEQYEYIEKSLASLIENKDTIDSEIENNLHNWTLNRLLRIDVAILRTAVNEMLFTKTAPIEVTINESVELAKRYSDERSYRFINGVLSSIYKKQQ